MKSNWKKVKLGEVCNILDNLRIPITASNRTKGKYPYYGANGIQDKVADYIFDDELVLLAEDGGNFGSKEKPIAYRVSGKCWVNNHAHVLKEKDEKTLDIDYLCYSLMFYDLTNYINGATRQKLTQTAMKKIHLFLPPLQEQKEIVGILDKLNNIIKKYKQQLEKLDELIKSKFNEMFGDPIDNTKEWKKCILEKVCDVRDGTHDSPKYIAYGNHALITSKNIKNGEFDFSVLNYITDEDYDKINKRSKVDVGDMLMPMIGTIGNPIIIKEEVSFAIKNVALFKFNKQNKLKNIYLQFLLKSNFFEYIMQQEIKGGTQKFFALKNIRKMVVPIPPIELQNKFAEFVKKIENLKEKFQKQINLYTELLNKKMDEYFN